MKIEDYCPHLLERNWAEMLVELKKCSICHKLMLPDYPAHFARSIFPTYFPIDFNAQLKKAGWEKMSDVKVDDNYICEECAKSGKADFLCVLCGQRKLTDKIEESFGDPPEFLCSDCYATVSAKIWDDKVEELRDIHRWDFE